MTPFPAFYSRFSVFFSFIDLTGFFFCSFFWSIPLLMGISCARGAGLRVAVGPSSMRRWMALTHVPSRLRRRSGRRRVPAQPAPRHYSGIAMRP